MSVIRSRQAAIRLLLIAFLLLGCKIASAAGSDFVNWRLHLTIAVHTADPGKIATHSLWSGPGVIKTIQVPAGATLELTLRTDNESGGESDGTVTDIWLDWPHRTLPTDEVPSDYVCLPENADDCLLWTKSVNVDLAFPGKQGKGIYNFFGWVDRYDTATEMHEDDNVLGPVTIKVMPAILKKREPLILKPPTAEKTLRSTRKVEQENKAVEQKNTTIESKKKEAAELEPELKELEQGGGG